jgi:predicted nucleotidyltransferase
MYNKSAIYYISEADMSPDYQVLEQLKCKIIELVHPLKIILFGSAARGEMHADSDLDIMVVMPEGTHRRHTAQHLYQHIEGIKIPYEIVVATEQDMEKNKDNSSLIYKSVLKEGKPLYNA